jgi:hypothetical protein
MQVPSNARKEEAVVEEENAPLRLDKKLGRPDRVKRH